MIVGRSLFVMGNELITDEITKLVAKARLAKMHGFSTVTVKFSDFRMVSLKVELDTPKEEMNNIYKNYLTVVSGTSSICG